MAEEATDGDIGIVTVDVPYLDIHGNPKSGQARIFIRRRDLERHKPIPIFFCAHYEKKQPDQWCDAGWAVVTAHYGRYPMDVSIGDGFNLAHAIVEWARRLPFVDRKHLHVDGGSQGGYMALAIAADFLQVTAVSADSPVMNWDYTLGYWEVNKSATKYPQADATKSPLPFLCLVQVLADQSFAVFGSNLTSETYYELSPLSFLERITSPVLMICSTADMLVPMEAITRTRLGQVNPVHFPSGYVRDFNSLTGCSDARRVLDEVLPGNRVSWATLPLPKDTSEYLITTALAQKPANSGPGKRDLPWSKRHQWSICVLDEGGPTPGANHKRYVWSLSPDSFAKAYKQQPGGVGLLNQAKLETLLQRYQGRLDHAPKLADGTSANRLNYGYVEKLDVVTALLDYAQMGKAYAANLNTLYGAAKAHPLGDVLNVTTLQRAKKSLNVTLAASR